jgi:NADPH2 dehydrogenase
MSPMCMYSCVNRDGKITDFHRTHYTSRAVGQVGLIIFEASAVVPNGRISYEDLGIWSDDHIAGLKSVVDAIHGYGSKAGIQLAHAGRKAQLDEKIDAPSAIAFDEMRVPHELTTDEIKSLVTSFKHAARRAKEAGFDVVEIHAAHGYLINEFLSPLANFRTDEYGGSERNRYRFLQQVIDGVMQEFSGVLSVRISASEYAQGGNTPETYVRYAKLMQAQGVSLIDCSSGGIESLIFFICR